MLWLEPDTQVDAGPKASPGTRCLDHSMGGGLHLAGDMKGLGIDVIDTLLKRLLILRRQRKAKHRNTICFICLIVCLGIIYEYTIFLINDQIIIPAAG